MQRLSFARRLNITTAICLVPSYVSIIGRLSLARRVLYRRFHCNCSVLAQATLQLPAIHKKSLADLRWIQWTLYTYRLTFVQIQAFCMISTLSWICIEARCTLRAEVCMIIPLACWVTLYTGVGRFRLRNTNVAASFTWPLGSHSIRIKWSVKTVNLALPCLTTDLGLGVGEKYPLVNLDPARKPGSSRKTTTNISSVFILTVLWLSIANSELAELLNMTHKQLVH